MTGCLNERGGLCCWLMMTMVAALPKRRSAHDERLGAAEGSSSVQPTNRLIDRSMGRIDQITTGNIAGGGHGHGGRDDGAALETRAAAGAGGQGYGTVRSLWSLYI